VRLAAGFLFLGSSSISWSPGAAVGMWSALACECGGVWPTPAVPGGGGSG